MKNYINTQQPLDQMDLKILQYLQHDASLSNLALAAKLALSPPTCLRRVKRLNDGGWIAKQVAVLDLDRVGASLGHGVCAIVEVTLDAQGAEHADAFEAKAVAEDAVQQCWRVSSGPDFVLIVQALSMPGYLDLTRRLLTQDANVRNVKAFFSLKRAKFSTELPLPRVEDLAQRLAPS